MIKGAAEFVRENGADFPENKPSGFKAPSGSAWLVLQVDGAADTRTWPKPVVWSDVVKFCDWQGFIDILRAREEG